MVRKQKDRGCSRTTLAQPCGWPKGSQGSDHQTANLGERLIQGQTTVADRHSFAHDLVSAHLCTLESRNEVDIKSPAIHIPAQSGRLWIALRFALRDRGRILRATYRVAQNWVRWVQRFQALTTQLFPQKWSAKREG